MKSLRFFIFLLIAHPYVYGKVIIYFISETHKEEIEEGATKNSTTLFREDPFEATFIKKVLMNTIMAIGTGQGVFYLQYPKPTTTNTSEKVDEKTKTATNVQGIIVVSGTNTPESFITTTRGGRGWQLGNRFDKTMKISLSFFNNNFYLGDQIGPIAEESSYLTMPPFTGNIALGKNLIHTNEGRGTDIGSYNIALGYNNNNNFFKRGSYNITIGTNTMVIKKSLNQNTLINDRNTGINSASISNYNICFGNKTLQCSTTYNISGPFTQNIFIGNVQGKGGKNIIGNIVIGNNNIFYEKNVTVNVSNNILLGNGTLFHYFGTKPSSNFNNSVVILTKDLSTPQPYPSYSDQYDMNSSLFLGTIGNSPSGYCYATFIRGIATTIDPVEGSGPCQAVWSTSDGMIGFFNPKALDHAPLPPAIVDQEANKLMSLSIIGINATELDHYYHTVILRTNVQVDPHAALGNLNYVTYMLQYNTYNSTITTFYKPFYEDALLVPLIIRALQLLNAKLSILSRREVTIMRLVKEILIALKKEGKDEEAAMLWQKLLPLFLPKV